MPPSKITYELPSDAPSSVLREDGLESGFVGTLQGLKYEYRPDITDRASLERNFREKFASLNRVRLTDGEFARLLDEIVTPDVLTKHDAAELASIALRAFVDGILQRMIFDGEQLSDLMAPLDLGWKDRTQAELALMADLHPLLTKRAQGRDISGLSAYEQ